VPAGSETASPPKEAAHLVREALEGMLRQEGLLVPPPFPTTRWETPATPGLPPGSTRLVFEANLLEINVTTEDLKRKLQATFEASPLFMRSGREASAYKGIDIESVDLVEKASDTSPVTRFVVRTTPYVPEVVATRQPVAARTPTREEVESGLRRFFISEGVKTRDFQISEPFPEVATVGPRVARTLQADALVALFISILGIIFYLSLRFEFIYGLAGIIALLHDTMVGIGIMAVTDMLFPTTFPVKLNLNELAAILTIIGFSINDTIVLFDRIRENNELLTRRKMTIEDNVNISINQTLARTLWTSTTVLFTTLMLLAFGGEAIRGFAFLFAVGTVAGVYSTVFIASPIVIWLHKRALARRQALATASSGT
jgi:preprotein translocase SecF subunit